MPYLIEKPTRIEAAGNKPKIINEHIGQVNSGDGRISVAHMQSPAGWIEPGQKPGFDEYTLVLKGMLRVEHLEGTIDVLAGQASSRAPASGCATARRRMKAPSTSPSACPRFRWKR